MKKQLFIPLVSLTALNLVAAASAANWPSWRGDIAGSGISSEPNAPTSWSKTKNVLCLGAQ